MTRFMASIVTRFLESAHDSAQGSDVARAETTRKPCSDSLNSDPVAGLDAQSLPYALRERDSTLTGQGCVCHG